MSDILNIFFPMLKKHFPDCGEQEIQLYDTGRDHYVFVVDDKHVVRFPRSPLHGKQDHIISEFSQMFAPLSPLPIQKMTSHIDSKTGQKYQTYEFIRGVPLTKEVARTLPKDTLLSIAKDMGRFLSALHSYPIEKVKSLGAESLISPRDYADYFTSIIDVDKKLIGNLLTKEEWEWFEKNVKAFARLSYEHPYEFAVTHSDMLSEHILIDETTHQLSGIIDFTLRIADPANDFKYFDRYGDMFLQTVYENYLPVDEFFDKRRKFYARDLLLSSLYQSVEKNDDPSRQEKYLQELREYIANHM